MGNGNHDTLDCKTKCSLFFSQQYLVLRVMTSIQPCELDNDPIVARAAWFITQGTGFLDCFGGR